MATDGDARAFVWLVAETVIERLTVYVSGAPVEELECQEDWLAEAESSRCRRNSRGTAPIQITR